MMVSCGQKGPGPAAVIDGESISGEYFLSTRSSNFSEVASDRQVEQLESFYHTVLRAYDAEQQGMDERDEVQNEIHGKQRRIKVSQLYEAYVVDSVITDEMIRQTYENMDERRHIRHILIADSTTSRSQDRSPEEAEELAKTVKQKIESGELTFEEAVLEYSTGQAVADTGDLGTVRWGQMVGSFQEAAWDLPLNTLSDPVKTRYGYHLIEVLDVDTLDRGTFEEERAQIEERLQRARRQQLGQRTRATLEKIKEETNFSSNPEAIKNNVAQLVKVYTQMSDTGSEPTYNEMVAQIDYQPIGTLGDGEITKDQFRKMLNTITNEKSRIMQNENFLMQMVNRILQEEYISMYADEYGIENYSDTEYKLRWEKDQVLDTYYLENSVLRDFPPANDSLRAFYEKMKADKYSEPSEVHVREIYVSDKETADEVRSKLDAGAEFNELASQYTERPEFKETGGDLGWFTTDRYGAIGKKATAMEIGSVEGPLQVGTGWSIIKLLDRNKGETHPYEEIKGTVKQDYIDMYRPKLIEKNLKNLEQKYGSEIYYSVLDNV
ncbi:MAG: peptidylprolyl isomerase [Candidatus Marinimicrobia bacterium]|nr:peptidylprolyl isomerase [Candidatus Neomarinimicrobiota bacterium]MCF7829123.1 peptidylprolyl isomerase [Candidatus Neomarinimicrobiota bacterium]MCF7881478.1 peptidylprolyl isomerase [Candidatus Neomarinimicrobiota bacterium]